MVERLHNCSHKDWTDDRVVNGVSICNGCDNCIAWKHKHSPKTPLKDVVVYKDKKGYFWKNQGHRRPLWANAMKRIAKAQGLERCKVVKVN